MFIDVEKNVGTKVDLSAWYSRNNHNLDSVFVT